MNVVINGAGKNKDQGEGSSRNEGAGVSGSLKPSVRSGSGGSREG